MNDFIYSYFFQTSILLGSIIAYLFSRELSQL